MLRADPYPEPSFERRLRLAYRRRDGDGLGRLIVLPISRFGVNADHTIARGRAQAL